MTEQEIRLELAKAFVLSGRKMDCTLSELYDWVTETDGKDAKRTQAGKTTIPEMLAYIEGMASYRWVVGKLRNVFLYYHINTVGDLLEAGRHEFSKYRNVGKKMVCAIDDYLFEVHDIANW